MEKCFVCSSEFELVDYAHHCSSCHREIIAEQSGDLARAAQRVVDAEQSLVAARASASTALATHDFDGPSSSPSLAVLRENERVAAMGRESADLRGLLAKVEQSIGDTEARISRKRVALSAALRARDQATSSVGKADSPGNVAIKLRQVRDKLEARTARSRRDLVRSLLSFFPLNPISETEHQLVNLILPDDSRQFVGHVDPDQIAAGLGYVVQLLLIAERYLAVPLPFPVRFMGSKSFVRDRDGVDYFLSMDDAEAEYLDVASFESGSGAGHGDERPDDGTAGNGDGDGRESPLLAGGGAFNDVGAGGGGPLAPAPVSDRPSDELAVCADDPFLASAADARFARALWLLNENVLWLCSAQAVHGVADQNDWRLLPNLLKLLRSPTLGSN